MWGLRFNSSVCREPETLPVSETQWGHLAPEEIPLHLEHRKPCCPIDPACPLLACKLQESVSCRSEKAQILPKINCIHSAMLGNTGVMNPWALGWRLAWRWGLLRWKLPTALGHCAPIQKMGSSGDLSLSGARRHPQREEPEGAAGRSRCWLAARARRESQVSDSPTPRQSKPASKAPTASECWFGRGFAAFNHLLTHYP